MGIYSFVFLYGIYLRLVAEILIELPAVAQLFRWVQWIGQIAAGIIGLF